MFGRMFLAITGISLFQIFFYRLKNGAWPAIRDPYVVDWDGR